MSPASIARALWPAARRLVISIGRWLLRRLRRVGAQKLAGRMQRRALGYQTHRLKAAKRRGTKAWVKFRTAQIRRWLAAAAWLRRNAKKLNNAAADALNALALADRIPMTLPREGRV